jgi:hypothetical protein
MGGLDNPIQWRQFDLSLLTSGPLFFYVGAGLSIAAGLVGWSDLASTIWLFRNSYEGAKQTSFPIGSGRENAKYLQDFIDEVGGDGHRILSRHSVDQRTFGRTVLLNLLLRYKAPRRSMIHDELSGLISKSSGNTGTAGRPIKDRDLELHSLIWNTKCQGIFTTNYDMLLEEAFLLPGYNKRVEIYGHPGPLRSYRYNVSFLRFLMSNPRFILKLHGDINDISTMILDPYSAWDDPDLLDGAYGEDLKRIYTAALQLGHMIYVGSGLRDRTFIELHCESRGLRVPNQYQKIALIPDWEIPEIIAESDDNVSMLDDIIFLTYGDMSRMYIERVSPAKEVRAFLASIVALNRSPLKAECPEALSIWSQIFRGSATPKRSFFTEDWTVRGISNPGASID